MVAITDASSGDNPTSVIVITVLVLKTVSTGPASPVAMESLEAVDNILSKISATPLDLSLHLRHIELAKALEDLEFQLTAFQTLTQFLAVGDEIWLPYVDAKAKYLDLDTVEGVEELLQLYERAEEDYLCRSDPFRSEDDSNMPTF